MPSMLEVVRSKVELCREEGGMYGRERERGGEDQEREGGVWGGGEREG